MKEFVRRLAELVEADQADRRALMPEGTEERDRERRSAVHDILDSGTDLGPEDLAAAALILRHSPDVDDIDRAHRLAGQSCAAGHRKAGWLVAATADRAASYRGLPQPYGTQLASDVDRWRVWDVDPATTDDDRRRLGLPPLATLIADGLAMADSLPVPPPGAQLPDHLRQARARWQAEREH